VDKILFSNHKLLLRTQPQSFS